MEIITKEKREKRHEQLDSLTISRIYKLIKDNLKDTELALSVSLQLRSIEEFNRLKKKELENLLKTKSERLREIAEELEY